MAARGSASAQRGSKPYRSEFCASYGNFGNDFRACGISAGLMFFTNSLTRSQTLFRGNPRKSCSATSTSAQDNCDVVLGASPARSALRRPLDTMDGCALSVATVGSEAVSATWELALLR